jgi:hypothetical protein
MKLDQNNNLAGCDSSITKHGTKHSTNHVDVLMSMSMYTSWVSKWPHKIMLAALAS